jgi:carboxyl-terminal processing protease
MREDDKTQNRTGDPAGGPTSWTPADSPQGDWPPPPADATPWSPAAPATPAAPVPPAAPAGPTPWSPAAPADANTWSTPVPADPSPWAPRPAAPVPPAPPAVPGSWPPAPPTTPPSWNANPSWQPNPSLPPNQNWNASPSWQPNQGWNSGQGWQPAPPPPPQWNAPAPTDRPLPKRPSRVPGVLMVLALCMISFSAGLVVDHYGFAPAAGTNGAQPTAALPAGSLQGSSLYQQALQVVRQNFVGRASVTDQQLVYGSIKGMVDSLGDTGHSVFLTPAEYQSFQNSLNASVAGIGVLVSSSSGPIVIDKVIANSPAAAAGLRAGDQISAVDGSSTAGQTFDQVSAKIRGAAGTTVKVTIIRAGSAAPIDFTITRAQVSVPLVGWGMVPGTHVADIGLAEFSTGATDQLKAAIADATTAGATSIVLDLRGNPGGYASEATGVASQFLTDGVVYMEQDASGNNTKISVDTSQPHTKLPLAVLVDHDSASSSEIVAGALQDSARAKIVGEPTFGTGTVLQRFDLADGSVIFLGTAYWLTPNGHKIFGVGIKPDETVALASGAVPVDPTQLGSMTAAQLSSSGDAELLAAVKDLTQ